MVNDPLKDIQTKEDELENDVAKASENARGDLISLKKDQEAEIDNMGDSLKDEIGAIDKKALEEAGKKEAEIEEDHKKKVSSLKKVDQKLIDELADTVADKL
jgi:hypothetical protein